MTDIFVPEEVHRLVAHIASTLESGLNRMEEDSQIRDIKLQTDPLIWEVGLGSLNDRHGPTGTTYDSFPLVLIEDGEYENESGQIREVRGHSSPGGKISIYSQIDGLRGTIERSIEKGIDVVRMTEMTGHHLSIVRRALAVIHFTSHVMRQYAEQLKIPGVEYGNQFSFLIDPKLHDITGFCLESLLPGSGVQPKVVSGEDLTPVAILGEDVPKYLVNTGIPLEQLMSSPLSRA